MGNFYRYIKDGHFLPGLPTRDLDESELTPAQVELMKLAVKLGLYERVRSQRQKDVKDESDPSDAIGQARNNS